MIKVKESDIKKELFVCPYCMNDVNMDKFGCCGESSDHFSTAYLLNNGEAYLPDEIEIVESL